jgi:hypothetical protein
LQKVSAVVVLAADCRRLEQQHPACACALQRVAMLGKPCSQLLTHA